jgi:hypothetical protein
MVSSQLQCSFSSSGCADCKWNADDLPIFAYAFSFLFVTLIGGSLAKPLATESMAWKHCESSRYVFFELVYREPKYAPKGCCMSLCKGHDSQIRNIQRREDLLKKWQGMSWDQIPGLQGRMLRSLIDTDKYTPDDVLDSNMEVLFIAMNKSYTPGKCSQNCGWIVVAICMVGLFVMVQVVGKAISGHDLLKPALVAFFGGYFNGYATFFLLQPPQFYKKWRAETKKGSIKFEDKRTTPLEIELSSAGDTGATGSNLQNAPPRSPRVTYSPMEAEVYSNDAIPTLDATVNWVPVPAATKQQGDFSFEFPAAIELPSEHKSLDIAKLENSPVAEAVRPRGSIVNENPFAGLQAQIEEVLCESDATKGNLNGNMQSGSRMSSQLSREVRQQPESLVGRRVAVVVHSEPEKNREGIVTGVKGGIGRTTLHSIHFDDSGKDEDVVLRKAKAQQGGFKFYLLED